MFHPVINNPQAGYYIFMNPTEDFIDSQNRLRESIVNNICRNYNIQQIFINPQDEVKSQGDSDGDLNPALLSKWIPEARGNKIKGYGIDGYKYYEHNFGNNNKTTFILPPKKMQMLYGLLSSNYYLLIIIYLMDMKMMKMVILMKAVTYVMVH